MIRALVFIISGCWVFAAQAFTLVISSNNFQINPIYSDIRFFSFTIDIDAPLRRATYINPKINRITYQIRGNLASGTRSGLSSVNLRRTISGDEFYRQGSSLRFQISPTAVFNDGVQAAELVGIGPIFTFNGRETNTGRYHPALFQLNANGSGSIRNSDNIPSFNPRISINYGDEYISNLLYDSGNLTIISSPDSNNSGFYISGGGAVGIVELLLLFLGVALLLVNRWRASGY